MKLPETVIWEERKRGRRSSVWLNFRRKKKEGQWKVRKERKGGRRRRYNMWPQKKKRSAAEKEKKKKVLAAEGEKRGGAQRGDGDFSVDGEKTIHTPTKGVGEGLESRLWGRWKKADVKRKGITSN